ncbi:MAG: biotin transport system substrate-specific component [Blastocatellia bacterium]|nr:biotin transport system substrate-specific component [Blastocatellia bacterium]
MDASFAKTDTLGSAALAPLDSVRSVGIVVAFSLLTALSAQVVIPMWPVPMTGQTFVVLLTGALLGSRLGAAAMIVYLIEGASGLPFFQQGNGGLAYLLGPTGGYLVAFPAAAFVTGAFAEHGWDKRFLTAAAAMFIGSILILLSGWAWLSVLRNPSFAFQAGVAPFIVGDIVKIALAAAVLPTGWALLRRRPSEKD